MKINGDLIIGNTGKTVEGAIDIVETGGNTQGNYIKFVNGIMICYGIQQVPSVDLNREWGGLYVSTLQNSIYFPLEFVNIPICSINFESPGHGFVIPGGYTRYNCTAPFYLGSGVLKLGVVSGYISYIAIGRWKI